MMPWPIKIAFSIQTQEITQKSSTTYSLKSLTWASDLSSGNIFVRTKGSRGGVPVAGVPEGCTYQSLDSLFPSVSKLDGGLGGRSSVKGKHSEFGTSVTTLVNGVRNKDAGSKGLENGPAYYIFRNAFQHYSVQFNGTLSTKDNHTQHFIVICVIKEPYLVLRYDDIHGQIWVVQVVKLILPEACQNY